MAIAGGSSWEAPGQSPGNDLCSAQVVTWAVSGYVEQSADSHAPLLSVRESALFSALLRLLPYTTRQAARAAA